MTTTTEATATPSKSRKNKPTQAQAIKVLKRLLEKEVPLYTLCKLSKKHINSLYSMGYNFYSEKKYAEAYKIFQTMIFFDHFDKRGWMGLGASCEMQGKYTNALEPYSYAAFLDKDDPRALFHIVDCLLALKEYPKAIAALECIILVAGDDPEKAAFKKKAEGMRDALSATAQPA